MARHSVERLVGPLAAGLLVLLALLGLIGTAIRDPRPHDIPVGIVGPEQATSQLTAGLNANAPGTRKFTTYDPPAKATTALDDRDVDAVLVPGRPPAPGVARGAGAA